MNYEPVRWPILLGRGSRMRRNRPPQKSMMGTAALYKSTFADDKVAGREIVALITHNQVNGMFNILVRGESRAHSLRPQICPKPEKKQRAALRSARQVCRYVRSLLKMQERTLPTEEERKREHERVMRAAVKSVFASVKLKKT